MSIYPKKSYPVTVGLSEFEILKASHKFLREETNEDLHDDVKKGETEAGASTNMDQKRWEDRLAEKYYKSLYREFAVCDLKHYKSGNFALRWRTESEVLSGAGESTCGNTRCKYHFNSTQGNGFGSKKEKRRKEPQLTTLELPFGYIEHDGAKSALVKVVLCGRCFKKLMWKRTKDKEEKDMRERGVDPGMLSGNGGVSEDEDKEDEVEKTERKEKGKERGREKLEDSAGTREDDEVLQGLSTAEGLSGKMNDTRNKRDSHGEGHMLSTRGSRSRRQSSRSRSPRRYHLNSHSHSRHRDSREKCVIPR